MVISYENTSPVHIIDSYELNNAYYFNSKLYPINKSWRI